MSEFKVLEEDDMEVLAESALPNRDESNMVEKKLDQLITAVKGMKPVAPVVNVPAPVVNVPKFLTISPEQMKELTKKREVYVGGGNSGIVKLVTGADAVVNPATTEGQEAIVTAIENITPTDTSALATSANQTSQLALETTLNSLVETLQTLAVRLQVLASMANSGAPALRTIPIASVSTAVSGSLTTVTNLTNLTNFGTASPAKEVADDMNNMLVTLGNINNVTV